MHRNASRRIQPPCDCGAAVSRVACRLQGADPRAGFTTVELLAATIAAAVLALSVGAMLIYGYAAWRRHSEFVDMQRDATAAMHTIGWKVRAATASDATIPAADRLRIVTPSATVEFRASGADLIYDPDTGTGGDEEVLVDGRLQTFSPILVTGGVSVQLDLQTVDGEESAQTDAVFAFRN